MAGSDKRGTIYGTYEVSEQIGVSPWYWWADVPVRRRTSLFAAPFTRVEPGPAVRYRGIFLNDEAPALAGWAREKFGGFNHQFYARVFELILRLRGNYLWPAMWDNAFNEDDPENPRLADEYGVVMGTSHHEPMLRAQQEWKRHGSGPWNFQQNGAELEKFWSEGIRRNRAYESLITIGMRGDGDMPMSEDDNIALLQSIVAEQRRIIGEQMGTDPARVPQVWALYKEVQRYFEKGMRVPDDVTLLWCDDNWGNIRRLPTPEERKRPGGAGIYYHFDYVGGPRSYKWLNTYPISKVREQMNLAWQYGADRVWIVNVGDLKPMEFPIEFFLRYAWSPARWPASSLDEFGRLWAAREFGPGHAAEIASLVAGYTRLNAIRKPEHVAPETFSLVNYGEADRVVAQWDDLAARARAVDAALLPAARDAFYQLVLYPVLASGLTTRINVAAARNRLYAVQGRASTNAWEKAAQDLFGEDARMTADWNGRFAQGRWRHFMDQTHLGYTTWQEPVRNALPAVTRLQLPDEPSLGVAIDGRPDAWPTNNPSIARPSLPPMSPAGAAASHIEVFSRGTRPVRFAVASSAAWLRASPSEGATVDGQRVDVSVDWASVPPGESSAALTVTSPGSGTVTIAVPVSRQADPRLVGPGAGISLGAEHFDRALESGGAGWEVLPGFGPWGAGVESAPAAAPSQEAGAGASLEYSFSTPDAGAQVAVRVFVAPTLPFAPGRGLRFAVSVDAGAPQVDDYQPEVGDGGPWAQSVLDGVRRAAFHALVPAAGRHVLRLWRIDPGVVFERIEIDRGGIRPSYLGPPEAGPARP